MTTCQRKALGTPLQPQPTMPPNRDAVPTAPGITARGGLPYLLA